MPNVPNVPGVPALASYAAQTIALIFSDVVSALGIFGSPGWDVQLNGVSVLDFDSVVSFSFKQDSPVSDYPVEDGGFQSYDKVQLPAEIRLSVAAGGSVARRASFLQSINDEFNTVDLYDIVTPEEVYASFNFTRREVRTRESDRGVGLIIVELTFTQIRVTTTTTFSNTQQPGYGSDQNIGSVQPQQSSSFISDQFNSGEWGIG